MHGSLIFLFPLLSAAGSSCVCSLSYSGGFLFLFLFFLPLDGGGFFLCVVCTTFTFEVCGGVEVVLEEVLFVSFDMLVCPKDFFLVLSLWFHRYGLEGVWRGHMWVKGHGGLSHIVFWIGSILSLGNRHD